MKSETSSMTTAQHVRRIAAWALLAAAIVTALLVLTGCDRTSGKQQTDLCPLSLAYEASGQGMTVDEYIFSQQQIGNHAFDSEVGCTP